MCVCVLVECFFEMERKERMVWKIDYFLDCLVNCDIHFKTFIGCDGEGKEKTGQSVR